MDLRRTVVAGVLSVTVHMGVWAEDGPTVAVLGFRNKAGLGRFDVLAQSLERLVQAGLARAEGISVVERTRVRLVLSEMALASTGLFDPATCAKLGEALPADFHLYGTVAVQLASGSGFTAAAVTVTAQVRHLGTTRVVDEMQLRGKVGELMALARGVVRRVLQAVGSSTSAPSLPTMPAMVQLEVRRLLEMAADAKAGRDLASEEQCLTAAHFLAPDSPEVLYRLALSRRLNVTWAERHYPRYYHRRPGVSGQSPNNTDREAIGWLEEVLRQHPASPWFGDALWEIIHYRGCPLDRDAAWRLTMMHGTQSVRFGDIGVYLMCKVRTMTALDRQIEADLRRLECETDIDEELAQVFHCASHNPPFRACVRPAMEQARLILWWKQLFRLESEGHHRLAVEHILKWIEGNPDDPWNSEKLLRAAEHLRGPLGAPHGAVELYRLAIDTVTKHRGDAEGLRRGMAKRRQELTLMWFRQGRMRYVFRMLECRKTDWAWRARWAEKALAFWAEDERDFGYDLPHYRNHMLFELAHARLMAKEYVAAFDHYRALAGGRDVRHFFGRRATARRELLECAKQLGRAREAETLLARFDPGQTLSAAECPYRRHAVGLHNTEALVTWQGKLYCFVRFSPPPRIGPRQQEPLCMARLDPVTGERRRWPIEEFCITADVADSVIVRGRVWLATWGQGVFVHDLVTGTWENITVASGLLDNRVGALAVDEAQETIWCAFPSAAASCDILGERWRTIGHPELKKTFHICVHDSEVWFVRWKGALKVDRGTGAGTFAEHQQIPRMPLLQHEGLTYWLSKGRYLFRTDGAGEQVGPSLDAKRVHLGIHPLVVKDRLVFGVDGQIFAADFRKGRVVPLVARHLRAGGICDWRGYSAPMAVMDRVLFVGAGEGFGYDPEGDVGSGWRGPPGGAFGLLSFDMTWLDTGDVAVLPSLLERFAVHGGTTP